MKRVYFNNFETTLPMEHPQKEIIPVGINELIQYEYIHNKTQIENSRTEIASFLNVLPGEIFFAYDKFNSYTMLFKWMYFNKLTKIITNYNLLPNIHQFAKNHSIHIEYFNFNEGNKINLIKLEKSIKPGKTLLYFNHVSYPEGNLIPLKKIIKSAHSHNSVCGFNFSNSLHVLHIDFSTIDADFIILSSNKIYGHSAQQAVFFKQKLLPDILFEELFFQSKRDYGTEHTHSILSFVHGLKYAVQARTQLIAKYNLFKTQLEENLKGLPKINLLTNKGIENIFSFKTEYIEFLEHKLDIEGITADVINKKNENTSLVILSFSALNTTEEIYFFVQKLKKILHIETDM